MLIEAASILAVGGAGALLAGTRPNSSVFGPVVRDGLPGPFLYLTLDDGPNPEWTERILETLHSRSVPATFFMIGQLVRRFPAVARAVVEAAQEIGNHTHDHPNLVRQAPSDVRRQIDDAHRAIVDETGHTPKMFRPPYGRQTPLVRLALRRWGYVVVGWRVSARDFERPGADVIRRRIRDQLRPGAILLLHDGDPRNLSGDRGQTASALPGIIQDAQAAGYAFRPLSELLERSVGVPPQPPSGNANSGP